MTWANACAGSRGARRREPRPNAMRKIRGPASVFDGIGQLADGSRRPPGTLGAAFYARPFDVVRVDGENARR